MEASVETAKTLAPEAGMPEALRDLSSLGVRLACVSNAFMGADVLNRIMEERGLGRHLELTISSCETGIRKPDARIYQAALDAMRTTGLETVFVGDRIDADVEGPAKLGMRTVLTQQYRAEDPNIAPVKPDAVITHLRELPGVVEGMIKAAS
jgi:putative hydrolase of the HAD superfamily